MSLLAFIRKQIGTAFSSYEQYSGLYSAVFKSCANLITMSYWPPVEMIAGYAHHQLQYKAYTAAKPSRFIHSLRAAAISLSLDNAICSRKLMLFHRLNSTYKYYASYHYLGYHVKAWSVECYRLIFGKSALLTAACSSFLARSGILKQQGASCS